MFCLPNANPVDSQTLNYTPVAVGIVAAWIGLLWLLFARKTFTGRTMQISRSTLTQAARRQVEIATEKGVDMETAKSLEAKSV